jgi:hypothetical protein
MSSDSAGLYETDSFLFLTAATVGLLSTCVSLWRFGATVWG